MTGWEATAEIRRREAAAQPPRAAVVIVGVTGATSDEEVCTIHLNHTYWMLSRCWFSEL